MGVVVVVGIVRPGPRACSQRSGGSGRLGASVEPLPMNLQHVAIGIAHDGAERARAFYGGVLGLEERALPAGVDPERFIWFAVGDGLDLHLHLLDGDDPPAVRSHFCLLVGDELEPPAGTRRGGRHRHARSPALARARRVLLLRPVRQPDRVRAPAHV